MIKKLLLMYLCTCIKLTFGEAQYFMQNIIFNDGNFIVGGGSSTLPNKPCIKISQDGITWKSGYIDPTGADSASFVRGLYCNKNICVAGLDGGKNILYSSDNGLNWKYINLGVYNARSGNNVVYGEYKFVMNVDNAILYSYDGISWYKANLPVASNYEFTGNLEYGNNIFLAYTVAPVRELLASNDGINWSVLDTTKSPLDFLSPISFNFIANKAFYFGSVSSTPAGLIYSSDLINYNIQNKGTKFSTPEYHNNVMFSMVNYENTEISYDFGKTWLLTDNKTNPASPLKHYAYGNGVYAYENGVQNPKYSYDAIKWTDSKWEQTR